MKKFKLVLLALIIAILLSGCSTSILTPVDDLISPVSPSGDNAGILAAVDSYCDGGFSVKIPSSGKYTASFITCKLNGNDQEEAIAFYEPNDKLSTVNMAILSKTKEQWKVVNNVVGLGADVNRVELSDLNDDGRDEIIVSWGIISNSTVFNICVYALDDKLNPKLVAESISASEFTCVDINGDGVNELLTFKYASATESPMAELYSVRNNNKHFLGRTRLDGNIVSFPNIICSDSDGGAYVYADGLCANGKSMVTEILCWSDYYNAVISPYYSYSTGKTSATTRNNLITSRDIDGDGKIEIPIDKSVSKLPNSITAQNWVSHANSVLNHKKYSIACKNDGYILVVSNELLSKSKFKYDIENRELTVFKGKNELFSIITVVSTNYSEEKYNDYTQIMSNSGLIYLAKVSEKNDYKLSIDTLKSSIIAY